MNNSVNKIKQQISNCKKCSLHKTRGKVVLGDWNTKAKIIFIGIAPGRLGGDKTGIPFTKDKSGVLLRKLIKKSRISSSDVNITNVVRCNPKDEKGNNRNPSRKEIELCSGFLEKEIELINPKIIVPLGKIPTEYILKEKIKGMKKYHTKMIKKGKIIIFPMYHPSYITNYSGYKEKDYEKDFKRLGELI